jgi:hypothetical protein
VSFTVTFTGTNEVIANINREIAGLRTKSEKAMRGAALSVKQKTLPITPADTGNLRRSWFTEVFEAEDGFASAEIGFTASYAPYVHETDRIYKAPGTAWKFLERGLQAASTDVLKWFGKELDLSKSYRQAAFSESFQEAGPLGNMADDFGFVG